MFKKIIVIVICLVFGCVAFGQNSNDSLLIFQSRRLANLMKDSLGLSMSQADQIYAINLSLAQQKKSAFQLQPRELIGKRLQEIENSRDSLYRIVLSPSSFEAYRSKKIQLINKAPKG